MPRPCDLCGGAGECYQIRGVFYPPSTPEEVLETIPGYGGGTRCECICRTMTPGSNLDSVISERWGMNEQAKLRESIKHLWPELPTLKEIRMSEVLKLGMRVKDAFTCWEGIATARVQTLHGEDRVLVERMGDAAECWFAVGRLTIVNPVPASHYLKINAAGGTNEG